MLIVIHVEVLQIGYMETKMMNPTYNNYTKQSKANQILRNLRKVYSIIKLRGLTLRPWERD